MREVAVNTIKKIILCSFLAHKEKEGRDFKTPLSFLLCVSCIWDILVMRLFSFAQTLSHRISFR